MNITERFCKLATETFCNLEFLKFSVINVSECLAFKPLYTLYSYNFTILLQQNVLYATDIEIRSMYDICAKCLPPGNCPGQRLNTVSASARKPFFCSRLPLYTSPRPCCIARSLRRSDFNVITGVPPPVTGRYTVPGSRKPLFPYNTITSSCDHTLY